jgi:radical SAM protein (TIGR04043 family)
MPPPDTLLLKVELQSLGVRIAPESGLATRSGGAGPADGITVLMDGLVATIPANAAYVRRSPFSIGEGGMLLKDGKALRPVEVASEPAFYSRVTESGEPMRKVALRHGKDGVGSTVAQACARTKDACLFCGIAITRESGATLPVKQPEEVAQACAAACGEGFTHAVLTSGTTDLSDCGISHLSRSAAAVKRATAGSMKVHVQFEPPGDDSSIWDAAAHADSAAINMECFDPAILSRVAPGKASMGIERYKRAWKTAVEAFGEGQVTCFIIAGLGEQRGSVLEGCELLSSMGVYPYVLPLRPIPGTPMETCSPPSAGDMLALYGEAADIIRKSGLSSAMCSAGCVRCGACSAITDLV